MKDETRTEILAHFRLTGLFLLALLLIGSLTGCGGQRSLVRKDPSADLPQIDVPDADGAVIRGRAIVEISNESTTAFHRFLRRLSVPSAVAASGTTTITYTNAGSTNFAIDVAAFSPNGLTGNTLSLGNVTLSGLNDNNLRVCGTSGKSKCAQAAIRVYTTGSISGFVNAADGYGAPVYAGSLNPSQAIGLGTAGAVQVQTLPISILKNTMRLADFPSPTYAVSSDFSNAGAGNYVMTFVVEYVLLP